MHFAVKAAENFCDFRKFVACAVSVPCQHMTQMRWLFQARILHVSVFFFSTVHSRASLVLKLFSKTYSFTSPWKLQLEIVRKKKQCSG